MKTIEMHSEKYMNANMLNTTVEFASEEERCSPLHATNSIS